MKFNYVLLVDAEQRREVIETWKKFHYASQSKIVSTNGHFIFFLL